jgi:hypothetical protein
MSSRVRLLPALIGAAGVLFALRLGAMAAGAEQVEAGDPAAAEAVGTAEPAPEASKQKTAEAATHGPKPAEGGGQGAAPPPPSINQAQTKGEAEVLQNLGLRRVALDARERDLALREQLMSATEKRVSENLAARCWPNATRPKRRNWRLWSKLTKV